MQVMSNVTESKSVETKAVKTVSFKSLTSKWFFFAQLMIPNYNNGNFQVKNKANW